METTSPAKTKSTRLAAYTCLVPFERQSFKASLENREKADVLLDQYFQKTGFADQEKRFATTLTYGVLRHWYPLNVLITWGLGEFNDIKTVPAPSSQKQRLKALDVKLRLVLRVGLYQLFFMDSVPDYAAVTSSLELADQLKLPAKLKKQCHAILSNAANDTNFSPLKQALGALPLWPESWLSMLGRQFDTSSIQQMAETCNVPPGGIGIRINTLKVSISDYKQMLQDTGISFEISEAIPEWLWISNLSGSPTQLPGFDSGHVYIQDLSSVKASVLLSPKPGERVLDVCAAPGSKTTHMAALMQNQGRIIALESSERRSKQLVENCKRLGVENVEVLVCDALTWQPENPEGFDRILVDAPCSGSGTIRHQPDGLLQWRNDQVEGYCATQSALLEKVAVFLKPGGTLVYSTCSLDSRENQDVVNLFLKQHPALTCKQMDVSVITHQQDGFFAALIQK